MPYREERELVVRLHLSAAFDASYGGEEDGYEWYRAFDAEVRPAIVRAIVRVLSEHPGYRITPINRGLDAHEELELAVERIVPD